MYWFTYGYEFTCPHPAHRNLRAKEMCSNILIKKYSCLYDIRNGRYQESCVHMPDYEGSGKYNTCDTKMLVIEKTAVEDTKGTIKTFNHLVKN